MKHPYLCACLTFIMCVSAYHSGVRLNAAELWNSTGVGTGSPSSYYVEKKEGNSDSYYNSTRKPTANRQTALFNAKDPSTVTSGEGGLDAAIHAYKSVKLGNQRPSRQFKTMSAVAVANRQADIDHALQLEYNRRKATASLMIEVARQDNAAQAKARKDRQKDLAAMKAEKEAKAYEREQKKARALGRKSVYRASSSAASNSVRKRVTSSSSTMELKKPARLFNDPNL